MHPFGEVWIFTLKRLHSTLNAMNDHQASARAFEGGHSTIEYCLHIAGAEHYWASRLGACSPSERGTQLERCLFEGFLNEGPFPTELSNYTLSSAIEALEWTHSLIMPVYEAPTERQLSLELVSPIGDSVTGREGLLRLAQHAAYHTGQIVLLQQMVSIEN